ncbi:hypothetical protein FBEOM_7638 [Fusarium beomiforme]|uniref:F-box domain-containing protein n=1 Tax=Fusarium beomiforme TaxID=44412 RepID=A0A9P5AGZ4_9HYPO|nr:hypothetical protein FBEOM_7638 [Fusarium beomiforme]
MLEHVPDDIWAHVFFQLEGDVPEEEWQPPGTNISKSAYPPLCSLSRVCKRFRRIAQVSLYRNISLCSSSQQVLQIVRELQRVPDLGLITKQLCLRHHETLPPTDLLDNLTKIFLSQNDDGIPPSLKRVILRELTYSYSSTRVGISQKLEGLFLLLTPRLQKIDITLHPSSSIPFLLDGTFRTQEGYDRFKIETTEGPCYNGIPRALYFQGLETVALRAEGMRQRMPMRLTTCRGLLRHPNMKNLTLGGFIWHNDDFKNLGPSNVPSNLTRLELDDCVLESHSLKYILERCKSLHHLTMTFSIDQYCRITSYYLDAFGAVLREFGENLIELTILIKGEGEICVFRPGCVGSLRELAALRHLSIGRLNFVGPRHEGGEQKVALQDALPRSLETLTIIESEATVLRWEGTRGVNFEQTDEQILDMLILSQHLPNLKQVHVKLPDYLKPQGLPSNKDIEIEGWHIELQEYLLEVQMEDEEWVADVSFELHEAIATATRIG